MEDTNKKAKNKVVKKTKKALIKWIKVNKAYLISAGISATALILWILNIKDQTELEENWRSLKKTVLTKSNSKSVEDSFDINEGAHDCTKSSFKHASHSVREHVRNLPQGQRASSEKVALAKEKGINLDLGQTIVEGYSTGKPVA